MARVVLIDGHSVVYRSFFAFIRNPLRNSKGKNTSAVFGFAKTLHKVMADLKPDSCAVVFDAPGKTFRHEKFESYKLQRPPVPDELREQLPTVKELVRAWGLVTLEVPGVEADDVIGTIAHRATAEGNRVVIVTSDKDMLQLVGQRITVYDPWKGLEYGSEQVIEKLGVRPAQVVDLLALAGDASDNVPGVPGVGLKRAQEILRRHGSLSAALERDDRVRKSADIARLSRELVEIRTDIELAADLDRMRPTTPDLERLAELFEDMEFRSLLAEIRPPSMLAVEVAGLADMSVLEHARVLGFAIGVDGEAWVCADGKRAFRLEQRDLRRLAGLSATKTAHGIKEQLKFLHMRGADLGFPLFDTGIAAWLIEPNRKWHGIEKVATKFLQQGVSQPGAPAVATLAFRLHAAFEPQLQAMGLSRVANELEMPLIPVLAAMEERGVKVDTDVLRELECELAEERVHLEQDIWQAAGIQFNLASPKQLGQVLFERLKLARGRRTKTGYSTDQRVLSELARHHPLVDLVLRWRELTKLITTYLRPLCEIADAETRRIHTTFDQTGTSTGRLSALDPNLQNIPVRTAVGRKIRRAFTTDRGRVLISADYSQIELRVLAHLSGDERLREAFARGEDVHIATAAAIFDIPPESVTEEQRRIAKMVNYGIIYGMGGHGLALRVGLSRDEAASFVEAYLARFSGVARWRDETVETARRDGFVRTVSGRIRPVPEIASSNRVVAEAAARAALNAPVQGSAADIIKRAMICIDSELRSRTDAGIVLQIHDELLLEADEERADEVARLVKTEMEQAWPLDVGLTAAVSIGRNWDEVH